MVLYTGIYKKNHATFCGEKHVIVKNVEDRYASFLPKLLGDINPRHDDCWIRLYTWLLESIGIGSCFR